MTVCISLSKYLFSVTHGGLASGCPQNAIGYQNYQEDMISTTQTGNVRCCSYDGGSCESETIGCLTLTFSEAQEKCSEFGMRLCTVEELNTNICCSTGCSFDFELIWYRKGKLFCSTEFNSTSEVHLSFFGTPIVRILEFFFIKYHFSNKLFGTVICFDKILLINWNFFSHLLSPSVIWYQNIGYGSQIDAFGNCNC